MLGFVILSYNHPELTTQTLKSVLQCGVQPEQLALLHNGSELRHTQDLQARFANIQHWILEKNRGYTGGANAALKKAFTQWDWVVFLTNDCELLTLPTAPSHPSFVAPCIQFRKTDRVDSLGGGFSPATGQLWHCKTPAEFRALRGSSVPYIPGTAFMLHKEVFKKTGDFEEALGTYWEDVDFSQRVLRQGFPLELQPTWRLRHKIGKTCHKHSHYTLYLFQRNRKKISWRYTPIWQRGSLALCLLMSWTRLAWNLIRKGRRSELPLLGSAILS